MTVRSTTALALLAARSREGSVLHFQQLLQRLTRASLPVGAMGLLCACESTPPPTEPVPTTETTIPSAEPGPTMTTKEPDKPTTTAKSGAAPDCTQQGEWKASSDLKLNVPADAVMVGGVFFGMMRPSPMFSPLGPAEGDLCATAKDKKACETALPSDKNVPEEAGVLLVTTTESGATIYRDNKILDALKPIDTDNEALLALRVKKGAPIDCAPYKDEGTTVRPTDGGYLVSVVEGRGCNHAPTDIDRVEYFVSKDGKIEERDRDTIRKDQGGCVVGRRPEGLLTTIAPVGTELGVYLARMAHLEQSAVIAFDVLARELNALGAPAEFVSKARTFADDETRHARAAGALAQEEGASVPSVDWEARPMRDLKSLALENAYEGCVRETYGAAIAHHQALNAKDDRIRDMMATIAEEETRHAALSWQIHTWALEQLDQPSRDEVLNAMAEARVGLAQELLSEPGAIAEPLGLPRADEARALLSRLTEALFEG